MPTPKGFKHSPEARAKISAANRLRKMSLETRAKMSEVHRGVIKSPEHREKLAVASHGNKNAWKGGRYTDVHGYVFLFCPDHPLSSNRGYVREHRLVMEKRLGRILLRTEITHHINGIKDDNRDDNLSLFSSLGEHIKFHRNQEERL